MVSYTAFFAPATVSGFDSGRPRHHRSYQNPERQGPPLIEFRPYYSVTSIISNPNSQSQRGRVDGSLPSHQKM